MTDVAFFRNLNHVPLPENAAELRVHVEPILNDTNRKTRKDFFLALWRENRHLSYG